jgi:hypothetical protein
MRRILTVLLAAIFIICAPAQARRKAKLTHLPLPRTAAVTSVAAQIAPHAVDLSWIASTSTVAGYNVYRSYTSGGPYVLITPAPIAATQFSDANVSPRVTYFYVATAVDLSANESVKSNEAFAAIPSSFPPVTISKTVTCTVPAAGLGPVSEIISVDSSGAISGGGFCTVK